MKSVFVIAEIGQAHEGSLGILHSYIDAVSNTGVDAIKFQTHIAEAESSIYEPFRIKFSTQDETRFDYWKRMEFSESQWREIKNHCEERGLEFISSPFSIQAVELLESIGMKRYKIASGEVGNFLMLDKIARTKKPIIISSGMSSFSELEQTIEFLKPYGNELSILQCTTSYPVAPEKLGLNVLKELTEKFDLPVGLSDHSGTIYPSLAAVTLGASYIEVHATFHKEIFGPDTKSSLTLDQLTQAVEGIRFIERSLNNPVNKNNNNEYSELKKIFGKSLAVRTSLKMGHKITIEDLESKKPAEFGIPASDYTKVIGKKVIKDINKFSFLNYEDLE